MAVAPQVWVIPGMLVSYGEMVDTQQHNHPLLQLTMFCGTGSLLLSDNQASDDREVRCSLLNSNVPHILNMQKGWVVLIEPQSEIGRQLIKQLGNTDVLPFDGTSEALTQLDIDFPYQQVISFLNQLDNQVQWEHYLGEVSVNDNRINQLISKLNLCFTNECLKPENWRAEQVAKELALSESRFLHLFKQQMGIAWRPYLLWRRLICAVKLIIAGETATDAAYRAGFSDSAHLSRTFKAIFGISIRQSKAMFKLDS
ncbi:AraC family transcriptional regulator [Vibrio ponticus]|uniref:AraC family transcriptional regulator n=1 Tax=Vibrio ponticus TaxID=265668 RepID=A0A3N3DST4_9VIBR|nr:AraC family transcriptional regulator [Vibrio ponticus]ROV57469.1 AraC family transcriptional regulator [Vibrio ponticus]